MQAFRKELKNTSIRFEASESVDYGGVLFLLPFLLSSGLLRYQKHYQALDPGLYIFVDKLTKLEKENKLKIGSVRRMQMFEKQWVVNIQKPFGKPQIVVEYIGRYTHSIAISERRIKSYDDEKVVFFYKNYKQNGEQQEMQLEPKEFFRRFAMHILPHRFVKIRHFGVLSNFCRKKFVELGQKEVGKFVSQNDDFKPYPEDDDSEFQKKRQLPIGAKYSRMPPYLIVL